MATSVAGRVTMVLTRTAGGCRSFALAAAIVTIAVLGALSPRGTVPRFAALVPIAYSIAVLAYAATAFVLLATWRHARVQRSTLVLALSFCAGAVVLFVAMLALPLLPTLPPLITLFPQAGIWLYIFWHLIPAIGAFLYVGLRRKGDARASAGFTTRAIATSLLLTGCGTVFVLNFASSLPPLVARTSFAALVSSGVGPFTACLLAIAAWCAFRVTGTTRTDRALACSLLALTLELTLLMAGGERYSVSYYTGRFLLVLGALFVLVSAVRALIEARIELEGITTTVQRLAAVASQRADRIRALWEITSPADQSNAFGFDTLLRTATSAIRPRKVMFGTLCHLEDQTVVVDATSWTAPEGQQHRFTERVFRGAHFDLRTSMATALLTGPGAQAWDDITGIECDETLAHTLGWKGFTGTAIAIGRHTHFLMFGSPEAMTDEPFAEDDCAYVDVVASFVATRYTAELHFERLRFQIEHDALTGLHNRAQFRRALREDVSAAAPFTIAFVNLDGFKRINEGMGHMLGDEVLVEVAATLAAVDPADLVARMNGDEFGVLIRGAATPAAADEALDRYSRVFRTPFHTGDRDGTRLIKLGASIGAARFPDDGTSAEELMRRADVALSVAKRRGGSTTRFFDPPMVEILESSHVRLVELAEAIAGDQLFLEYQPTFDLATRRVTGAEALVRWNHPERGRLAPSEFIPFAERNGLITELTLWVLHRIIRDFSRSAPLPEEFRIYFNLAAQTLDDFSFIAALNEALRATPGLAQHLGIEMTETAAMQNLEGSMHTISLFRQRGLLVAIDDFGTGYSSLAYLKQLTVDVIKLDRSFVSGLPHDERDGAITDMLLQITDRFGLATLAEGIETEGQARWLLEHGCRSGQGYLVAKPGSFDALQSHLGSYSMTG
jgi:diguanylate cyclase (GGDEF)-like protein